MELSQLPLVLLLISNIHSGHTEDKVQLNVSPQKWVTEGDPVTLICEVKGSSTGWTFSWFTETVSSGSRNHQLLSDSSRGAGGKYTVSSAAINHTGVYMCKAEREKPDYKTLYSNTQPLWVTGVSPRVSLIISPSRTQHFTLVSLSLSCKDQSNSDGWTVRRYTDSWGRLEDCSSLVFGSQTGSTCTINSTIPEDTGVYWCQSESGDKYHPVNITVHFGVVLESPVHPVTEGDTLTLRCLYQFPNPSILRADFYKDESLIQSQTTEMIISTVSKSHEGFYYCKHPEMKKESLKSWISVRVGVILESPVHPVTEGDTLTLRCLDKSANTSILRADFYKYGSLIQNQTTEMIIPTVSKSHEGFYYCKHPETKKESTKSWISVRERPKPKVMIKPDQHVFSGETVTLRCVIDAEGVTSWRFNWYKEGSTSVFSEQQEHTFRSVNESDAGKYSCNGSDTEGSHRSHISDEVTLTVSAGVILESPVHPVTEGDTLTLRCLDQHRNPSILRADFYKDGSLIQSQTTEMIISTVSKSHEGFYYCKHPERGESLKSWISVRERSDGLIIGVTAGLTVVILIIVFVVLLWRFRNNKGVRSESPSAVRQQQNISQTSEQNQSEAGYNTPLSDGVRAPTEITYAEVELKSTNKQKKEKENKDKNTESCDVLYSELKLETDQGAGSSDVTYAQVK